MTNYINSIELDGSTYNIGPCYMSGNDNIVVGGSPSFSTGACSNIIIAPPSTNVSCGNANNGIFIQTGNVSIVAGSGLDVVNNDSDPWVKLGSAVTINADELIVGPYRITKESFSISYGSPHYMTFNRPAHMVILGLGSESIEDAEHHYDTQYAGINVCDIVVYGGYEGGYSVGFSRYIEDNIYCYGYRDNTISIATYEGYGEGDSNILNCVAFISTYI